MLRLHLRKVREKVRGGVANENGLSICIYEPTHLPRANENEKNPLASAIPGFVDVSDPCLVCVQNPLDVSGVFWGLFGDVLVMI